MQTVTAAYQAIREDPRWLAEHRAIIADVIYSQSVSLIGAPKVDGTLWGTGSPKVGCCVSRQLDIMVMPQGTIPRMAEIRLETRLVIKDLLTGEGTQSSEWLPKGTFFLDTRDPDKTSGVLVIHAYDAMLKAEEQYIPTDSESTSWPRKMPAVVADICYRMGVALDERTVLQDWDVEYPGDMTMREILGYIAACHVGNWTITDTGALRLVPLVPIGTAVDVGRAARTLSDPPAFDAFSGVQFHYDGKDTFSAGDDSGRVLEIEAAWATQEIADAALAAVQGYVYQPYEAAGAILDPAAELGDLVTVGGVTGLLAAMTTTFDALCASDIAAPSDQEVDHEYPYEDRSLRQTRREVAKATAAIRVGVDEIESRVEDAEGNISLIEQTVGSITLSVKSSSGADGQTYASITLRVGDKSTTEQILLNGNVDVSGQLSADALYAALGNIADLTVDKFSTSRRIKKYLAGDTSDDNHIRAQDEELLFVSGVYAGDYEQATSPSGGPLYWESDPDASGVVLGADGYPYLDGVRIFTTTAETDWPVYVFTYEEQVKASFAFEMYGDIYTPVLTLGAGNKDGLNKGVITKSADGLEIIYKANTGAAIGMRCGNDGFTDIFGMRKTTGMNFSEFDKGRFYERISGKADRYVYSVAFDAQGNPVLITDPDGHECTITW